MIEHLKLVKISNSELYKLKKICLLYLGLSPVFISADEDLASQPPPPIDLPWGKQHDNSTPRQYMRLMFGKSKDEISSSTYGQNADTSHANSKTG